MPAESTTLEFNDIELQLAYAQAARSLVAAAAVRDRHATTTPPPISPYGKVVAAGIKFLSPLLRELEELRTATPEKDEYGVLRATKHAYTTAADVLINAAIVAGLSGRQIPRGIVSTDSEGGIRIEWNRPHRSVRLIVPFSAERDGYVYHQEGSQYGTAAAIPESLAQWLRGID